MHHVGHGRGGFALHAASTRSAWLATFRGVLSSRVVIREHTKLPQASASGGAQPTGTTAPPAPHRQHGPECQLGLPPLPRALPPHAHRLSFCALQEASDRDERLSDAAFFVNASAPNTIMARGGGGGQPDYGSGGSLGATMERSKLSFVMPTPPQQGPKLDDSGSGGDNGKNLHNGGGGGGGDDDDDDDYFGEVGGGVADFGGSGPGQAGRRSRGQNRTAFVGAENRAAGCAGCALISEGGGSYGGGQPAMAAVPP